MRRLLLLALALCGLAHATPPPRIDLAASPAWKGWVRPGRVTEVEIRLATDTATRVKLDFVAGRHSVHAELDLEPGRVTRLHLPFKPADGVAASVQSPDAPWQRQDIGLARSESPLLGVGLSSSGAVSLAGFNAIALSPADLPRHASAYANVDALVLDSTTLSALDQRQLAALLGHAAACGRIVVLEADAHLRRLLEGAGGCRDRALMFASSLAQARQLLESSLAAGLPSATSLGGVGELARPNPAVWNRIVVLLAAYFAAAVLLALWSSSWPVLMLVPAVASAAVLAVLHAMQPPSQLVVWGEAESGAQVARYRAWQRFPGVVRERKRVPVPAQLASGASPCEAGPGMRFELDAAHERAISAEFDTRLFAQPALCYSGSFPMARVIAIDARPDGSRDLRNGGTTAWPDGVLLAGGRVHDLPALGPGVRLRLGATQTGTPRRDALVRAAMMRTPPDGVAVLWPLELAGAVDATVESSGWLLLSAAPP